MYRPKSDDNAKPGRTWPPFRSSMGISAVRIHPLY